MPSAPDFFDETAEPFFFLSYEPVGLLRWHNVSNEMRIRKIAHYCYLYIIEPLRGVSAHRIRGGEVKSKIHKSMFKRVVFPDEHTRKQLRIRVQIVMLQGHVMFVPSLACRFRCIIHQNGLRGVDMQGREDVSIAFGCVAVFAVKEGILIDLM